MFISPKGTGIHLDFAGPFKGKILLLVVDAFSKWIEVFVVHEMTTETIIYLLKAQLITRFGLPRTIITDNQTTFTSSKFQQFCANFGIKHILTPSYHPQSNGQVERYVQTTKQSLRKLMETGKNFNQELCNFLFQFRSTPTAAGVSPAELFLRRAIKPLNVWARARLEHSSAGLFISSSLALVSTIVWAHSRKERSLGNISFLPVSFASCTLRIVARNYRRS
ncbi:DDE-type integrase/transposase/recombinase, partial [Klebsiella pneumoniae]|uniref:DDE-type integrase/transposase/recombinase n=1 Tax=Klebsiella pneumoniae TaxID=573 RepID=UPI0040556C79